MRARQSSGAPGLLTRERHLRGGRRRRKRAGCAPLRTPREPSTGGDPATGATGCWTSLSGSGTRRGCGGSETAAPPPPADRSDHRNPAHREGAVSGAIPAPGEGGLPAFPIPDTNRKCIWYRKQIANVSSPDLPDHATFVQAELPVCPPRVCVITGRRQDSA